MRNLLMTILLIFSCTSLALAQDDYHKVEAFVGYSYNSVDKIAGSEFTSTTVGVPTSPGKRKGLNGFDTSITYNFSRYIGAKFDLSGHYGETTGTPILLPSSTYSQPVIGTLTVPATFNDARFTSYSFLGGIQIKDNSKDKRIKPFAHVLLGVARQTAKYKGFGEATFDTRQIVVGSNKVTNNGFSWALGGGLDIRVHRRIDIRVIQVDYNPVRTKEQTILAVGDRRDFSILTFFVPPFNQATALNGISIPSRTQHNFRVGVGIVFH